MLIPGRLCRTTLGDILGGLSRLEATGTLELEELPPHQRLHRIEIREGRVAVVHSQPGEHLGTFLGRERFQQGDPSKTAAELWLESGYSEGAVLDALRTQRRARLEYLFALSDARIAFRAPRSEPVRGLPLPQLSPCEVLVGRPRYAPRHATDDAAIPSRAMMLRTLGLPPDAGPLEVRRAFRELARALHPDCASEVDSKERDRLAKRFAQITGVYHQLLA